MASEIEGKLWETSGKDSLPPTPTMKGAGHVRRTFPLPLVHPVMHRLWHPYDNRKAISLDEAIDTSSLSAVILQPDSFQPI